MRQIKDLNPTELAHLKGVAQEIQALEQRQSDMFDQMIHDLQLESSDELFDICYNFAEIKHN